MHPPRRGLLRRDLIVTMFEDLCRHFAFIEPFRVAVKGTPDHARVADHFAQIAQDEQDAERKSTVGTGDRSERIRTYNFPQNRVTDHRIGLTLQKLDTILAGKLDEVVDALVLYDQTQKLEELNK